MTIDFPDRHVTYERFIEDLASRIARKMQHANRAPEFISQRNAYKLFGRANVNRWRRTGQVEVFKRPGVVEYRTEDLRKLQQTVQDYLKR